MTAPKDKTMRFRFVCLAMLIPPALAHGTGNSAESGMNGNRLDAFLETALESATPEIDVGEVWLRLTSHCSSEPGMDGDAVLTRLAMEDSKRDLGFKADGAYKYYPGGYSGLGDIETAYLGLEWELLGDGLVANQLKSTRLAKILEASSHNRVFHCAQEEIRSYFLMQRRASLGRQSELLRYFAILSRRLYQLGKITLDEAEDQEREAAVSDAQFHRMEEYLQALGIGPRSDDPKDAGDLPLVDIKIGRMLAEAEAENAAAKPVHLYWEDTHLKLFARSYLRDEPGSQKKGAAVGVAVSFPLAYRSGSVWTNGERARIGSDVDSIAKRDKIRSSYQIFLDDLAEAMRFRFRMLALKDGLKAQDLRHRYEDTRYNPTVVMRLLGDAERTHYQFLDAEQKLYEHLLSIMALAASKDPGNLIRGVEMADDRKAVERIGERHVYIWSKSFNSLGNTYILDFLKAKGIGKAILSFGEGVDKEKLTGFLAEAKKENIGVRLMFSASEWLLPDNTAKIGKGLRSLNAYRGNFEGIHLDIEPQTLKGWESNREKFQDYYAAMLKTVRDSAGPSSNLTVSIPAVYTPQRLKEIFRNINAAYVMAYGRKSPEETAVKLEEELVFGPDRIILALRPDDFENEIVMEQFIQMVKTKTGIRTFAFHDLAQLLKMGE